MDVNGTARQCAGAVAAVVAAVAGAAEATEGRTTGQNAVTNGAEIATSGNAMKKTSLVVVADVAVGAAGDAEMEAMAIGSTAEVPVGMAVLDHRDHPGLQGLRDRLGLQAMVVGHLRHIPKHPLLHR